MSQLLLENQKLQQLQQQMQVQIQHVPVSPAEKAHSVLDAAVKTMRTTGLFGWDDSVNIEWPTAKDLMEMLKNIPTKITDLKYQKSTWNKGARFGAFQVTLSNGI